MTTERELDRIARIMKAHDDGTLDDVALYQMFAATRTEAVESERSRLIEWLELRARLHRGRGEIAEANAITASADAMRIVPKASA